MTRTVDLNADCGEGYGPWPLGDDAGVMRSVTSINMACGGHAGDPETMAATLRLARAGGVAVGAHPGYADREGFGRRVIPMALDQIERMCAAQIGAAMGMAALEGVRLGHVKAHGALANLAADEAEVAAAVARAARAVDRSLVLLAIAGTELVAAGERAGLRVASEIFADRAYLPSGRLVPRDRAGAVIREPAEAARRVRAMVEAGAVIAEDGTRLPVPVDSICVHGDAPGAAALARAVREGLEAGGVAVRPFVGAGP